MTREEVINKLNNLDIKQPMDYIFWQTDNEAYAPDEFSMELEMEGSNMKEYENYLLNIISDEDWDGKPVVLSEEEKHYNDWVINHNKNIPKKWMSKCVTLIKGESKYEFNNFNQLVDEICEKPVYDIRTWDEIDWSPYNFVKI